LPFEDPHGYLNLPTGEVIKKEWLEVYEFCQYHKAPIGWSKAFEHVESMGNFVKEKIRYSKK
jgi:hypothetical protein